MLQQLIKKFRRDYNTLIMYEKLFQQLANPSQQDLMKRLPNIKSVLLEIQIRTNPEKLAMLIKDKNNAYIQRLKACICSQDILYFIDQIFINKNSDYRITYVPNIKDPYYVAVRLFQGVQEENKYNFDSILQKYKQYQVHIDAHNKLTTKQRNNYEMLTKILSNQTQLKTYFDQKMFDNIAQLCPDQYIIAQYMYGKYEQLEQQLGNISADQILIAFCMLTSNPIYINRFLLRLQSVSLFNYVTQNAIIYLLLHNQGFRCIFNSTYYIHYDFLPVLLNDQIQSGFLLNNQLVYQAICVNNAYINDLILTNANEVSQQLTDLTYIISNDTLVYSDICEGPQLSFFLNIIVKSLNVLYRIKQSLLKQLQTDDSLLFYISQLEKIQEICYQLIAASAKRTDDALSYLDPEPLLDMLYKQYPLIQIQQVIVFRCLSEGTFFVQRLLSYCKEIAPKLTKDFVYFIQQSFRQCIIVLDLVNAPEEHQSRQKLHDHLKSLDEILGGAWDAMDENYGYPLHTMCNFNEISQRQLSLNNLLLQYNLEIKDIYNICMHQYSKQMSGTDIYKDISILLAISTNSIKNQKNLKLFTRFIQFFDYFIEKHSLFKPFHIDNEIQPDYLIVCQIIAIYIKNFQLIESERADVFRLNQQIEGIFALKKNLEKQTIDNLLMILESSRVFNFSNIQKAHSSNIIDSQISLQLDQYQLSMNQQADFLSLDSLKKQIVKEIQKATNYTQQQKIEEFASKCDYIRCQLMKYEQELKYLQEKLNKLYKQQNDNLDQQIQLIQNKIRNVNVQIQYLYQQDSQQQQSLSMQIHQDYVAVLYQIIKHDQTDAILQNQITQYREESFQSSQNIYINEIYIKRLVENEDLQKLDYIYNIINTLYIKSMNNDETQVLCFKTSRNCIFNGYCQYNMPPTDIKTSLYKQLDENTPILKRDFRWVKWWIYDMFICQTTSNSLSNQGEMALNSEQQRSYYANKLHDVMKIIEHIRNADEKYWIDSLIKKQANDFKLSLYDDDFKKMSHQWAVNYLLSEIVIPFYKMSFPRFTVIRSNMNPNILDTIKRDFYNDVINNRVDSITYTLTEDLQKIKCQKNTNSTHNLLKYDQLNNLSTEYVPQQYLEQYRYSQFIQQFDFQLLSMMAYLFIERRQGIFINEINFPLLQEMTFSTWHGYIYIVFVQEIRYLFTRIRNFDGDQLLQCGIFQNLLSQMLESNTILINQRILLQHAYYYEQKHQSSAQSKKCGKNYFYDLLIGQQNLLFISYKQLNQIIIETQMFELDVLQECYIDVINYNTCQQQEKQHLKKAFHFTDKPFLESHQLDDMDNYSDSNIQGQNQQIDLEKIKSQFSVTQQQIVLLEQAQSSQQHLENIVWPQQMQLFCRDYICKPSCTFIHHFFQYYMLINSQEVNNMMLSYYQIVKQNLQSVIYKLSDVLDQNIMEQIIGVINTITINDYIDRKGKQDQNGMKLQQLQHEVDNNITLSQPQMQLLQKPISIIEDSSCLFKQYVVSKNNIIMCHELLHRLKYLIGQLKLYYPSVCTQINIDVLYKTAVRLYS